MAGGGRDYHEFSFAKIQFDDDDRRVHRFAGIKAGLRNREVTKLPVFQLWGCDADTLIPRTEGFARVF